MQNVRFDDPRSISSSLTANIAFRAVAELVREQRRAYDLPPLATHPNDEMWRWSVLNDDTWDIAVFAYYRAGLAIAETLRSIVEIHEKALGRPVRRILDFACGYGRSLRFSAIDLGRERLWGAEILPAAVEFVSETFGVHSFESCSVPEDLRCDERFDVIFVSSLFSHLPRETFTRWLRTLHSLLTPVGLLCVSVHDAVMLPPGAEMSEDGFSFQALTEVDALETTDYGATVVCEEFMAGAIKDATGQERYRRLPTTLCFAQDMYLIPASNTVLLSADRLSHGAQGCIDHCDISDDLVLHAHGWAGIQDDHDAVSTVEMRIGGRFVASALTGTPRPDVATAFHQPASSDLAQSGWSCDVILDFAPTCDEVVMLTALTRLGRRDVVWSTPLNALHAGLETPVAAGAHGADTLLRRPPRLSHRAFEYARRAIRGRDRIRRQRAEQRAGAGTRS